MFSAIEFSISIDDELSALLADYTAFTGDGSASAGDLPQVLPSDPALVPAVALDPLAVVDPMVSADPMVFTGGTAAVASDAGVAADPAPATVGDAAPTDLPVDVTGLPGLDGLVQLDDGGFDLDLTILDVGRGFGQFGFNDLP